MDAARRNTLVRVAGWLVAAVVVVYVARSLGDGLSQLSREDLPERIRWDLVVASGALFLGAHALLIQTWRSMLATWNAHLPFWSAARIWSVSNLGKYVPGKIWQIGAMSAMSRESGISAIVAPSAAILGTLLSVITGFAVALATGRVILERTRAGWSGVATILLLVAGLAILLAPFVVPQVARLASRMTGRQIHTTLPMRAVVYGLAGNVVAWLLYGAAFRLLTIALTGHAGGGYAAYIATYTISYLFGYLALFAPAGIGVREGFMFEVLQTAGLATAPEAALVTIASRVWLTILEVTPALVFLVHYRTRPRTTHSPSDVPT